MREILFRGKRKDRGNWIEGWYCGKYCTEIFGDAEESNQIIEFDSLYWHEVIPETVGQFTGLTDKNGKKIFEGDVVRATIRRDEGFSESIRNEKGVIAFDSLGMMGLIIDRTGDNIPVWSDFFCELSLSGGVIDYYFEVIGNIHDNDLGDFDGN